MASLSLNKLLKTFRFLFMLFESFFKLFWLSHDPYILIFNRCSNHDFTWLFQMKISLFFRTTIYLDAFNSSMFLSTFLYILGI